MPDEPIVDPIPEPDPVPAPPLNTWFEVSINSGTGYMLLTDGAFWGYYGKDGKEIKPDPGTTVYVTKNDVIGPF